MIFKYATLVTLHNYVLLLGVNCNTQIWVSGSRYVIYWILYCSYRLFTILSIIQNIPLYRQRQCIFLNMPLIRVVVGCYTKSGQSNVFSELPLGDFSVPTLYRSERVHYRKQCNKCQRETTLYQVNGGVWYCDQSPSRTATLQKSRRRCITYLQLYYRYRLYTILFQICHS